MPRSQPSTWTFVAILAVLAYLGYFFSLELPSAPEYAAGKRSSRILVWTATIPGFIPDSQTPIGHAFQQLRHGESWPQRISVLAYAVLILLAAGGTGDCFLSVGRYLLRAINPTAIETAIVTSTRASKAGAAPLSPIPQISAGKRLDPLEHLVFTFGLGLNLLSLGMLGLGLLGWMSRLLISTVLAVAGTWLVVVVIRETRNWRTVTRSSVRPRSGHRKTPWSWIKQNCVAIAGVAAVSPFLLISLLGAMLPATDFDVLEYHLQGPKEYFLAGEISFAPHNVYMNMPFGTEMLSLLSMIVAGDWWWGALVGQTVLAAYAPLTAVGIAQLGRRCFGSAAGWFGALIYLTAPWIYRISVIPLTENALAFYLLAATLAARRAIDETDPRLRFGNWLLTGLLGGAAAACKYTALTSTVALIAVGALLLTVIAWRSPDQKRTKQRPWLIPAAVALGVFLTFGPWLIRNAVWTGNPTYPLLYNLFGGRNWSTEKNEKWEWGHRVALLVACGLQRPPPGVEHLTEDAQHAINAPQFLTNLHDVVVQSDWLSPLFFSLAPLALLGLRGRRSAGWLWLMVAFLFLQWWLLTHRNDRFWVPMLPLVAVLAGGGCSWTEHVAWKRFLAVIIPLVVWFNLSFSTTSLCGYNQFGAQLIPRRHTFDEGENWLRDHLRPEVRLLAVGEAAFFHLDRAVIYNTVFDDCWFVLWLGNRTPTEAAEELRRRQITHIFVNWSAIQRHRSPGGYGFPKEVTPARFQELTASGVLKRLPFDVADLAEPVSLDGHAVPPRELFEVRRAAPE